MIRALIGGAAIAAPLAVAAQTPVAQNVYRLPYQDGTEVLVSRNHADHAPVPNRIDMRGQGADSFEIVAAARGHIRRIVDDNSTFCPRGPSLGGFDLDGDGVFSTAEILAAQAATCGDYAGDSDFCCRRDLTPVFGIPCPDGGSCVAPNNYVWIEHENGEWTKYSHLQTGSVVARGHAEGDLVNAGDVLGLEGDVGLAGNRHLHFEVAAFDSVDQISASGYAPNTDGIDNFNWRNRVPVFCQLGLLADNATVTAVPCDDQCGSAEMTVTGATGSPPRLSQVGETMIVRATVAEGAGFSARAGERIVLEPGFEVAAGGFFAATIGGCDRPGGAGE